MILAGQLHPDLVLMDIRLLGNIDGIEAGDKIRSQLEIPVIYLTANADPATLQRAKLTEPSGYLIKPVEPKALQSAVEIAVYKHGMDKQLKDRERWLAAVLRSTSDAVAATDSHGDVTFMNPVAEILTGWQQTTAQGKGLGEIFNVTQE